MIFSELPQQDKIKYFNFLLENDINFSRDEQGNYVALVKVLNPAFYGGAQSNNKASLMNKDRMKKNSKPFLNEKGNKEEKKMDKIQPKFTGDLNQNFEQEIINNNIKDKKKKISSEYFEKEKKPTKQKSLQEMFEGRYQKFIQMVNPLVGIRGKRMNINDLHYCIEGKSRQLGACKSFDFLIFMLDFTSKL